MVKYYIDTNVFIYLADTTSKYSQLCSDFFNRSREKGDLLFASIETIQEIIYVGQKLKMVKQYLKLARYVKNLVDIILPLSTEVLSIYFKLVDKYKNIPSSDLIHASIMHVNGIKRIVTFDKDFSKIEEVEVVSLK